MKILNTSFLVLSLLVLGSCQSKANENKKVAIDNRAQEEKKEMAKLSTQDLNAYETAYFASGCFWCVEAIFESVKGVKEVVSGYSGGSEENPSYEQVARGLTTHAEAVEVYYDPEIISFIELVQVFFGSHDPTTLNRQGPDRGPQYRSVAFYKNPQEKKIIQSYIAALKEQNVYEGAPITTEVTEFTKFWKAEEYHQDYERKHPNNSYITNVSIPRLNRFKKNFGDYLKEDSH